MTRQVIYLAYNTLKAISGVQNVVICWCANSKICTKKRETEKFRLSIWLMKKLELEFQLFCGFDGLGNLDEFCLEFIFVGDACFEFGEFEFVDLV